MPPKYQILQQSIDKLAQDTITRTSSENVNTTALLKSQTTLTESIVNLTTILTQIHQTNSIITVKDEEVKGDAPPDELSSDDQELASKLADAIVKQLGLYKENIRKKVKPNDQAKPAEREMQIHVQQTNEETNLQPNEQIIPSIQEHVENHAENPSHEIIELEQESMEIDQGQDQKLLAVSNDAPPLKAQATAFGMIQQSQTQLPTLSFQKPEQKAQQKKATPIPSSTTTESIVSPPPPQKKALIKSEITPQPQLKTEIVFDEDEEDAMQKQLMDEMRKYS